MRSLISGPSVLVCLLLDPPPAYVVLTFFDLQKLKNLAVSLRFFRLLPSCRAWGGSVVLCMRIPRHRGHRSALMADGIPP